MNERNFKKQAERFMSQLPYLNQPYSKRGWGNRWHSLCSYQGKLKPSIAHLLVQEFSDEGDIVLDPMSGVGTIPLEACLQGRRGIGNDLSIFAYFVTQAKVNIPNIEDLNDKLEELETYIEKNKGNYLENDFPYKNFGFNGKLPDYFHKETYKEILAAREFFLSKEMDNEYAVIISSLLHVLHGNRPYALSRNSHPLTPYAPRGEFIYKNVMEHVRNKINLVYKDLKIKNFSTTSSLSKDSKVTAENDWSRYTVGDSYNCNVLELDREELPEVDIIITSPPFSGSIKFYTQNWMRLWFSGWEENDFKEAENLYLESLQKKSLDIYHDFFRVCNYLLKSKGKMILHLGKSKNCDMAKELSKISSEFFTTVYMADEDVSNIEKHGIRDKGATTHHQYLFLEKKL